MRIREDVHRASTSSSSSHGGSCDIEHSTRVWMCGHSVREHELARLVVVGGRDLQLGGHESGADLLLAQVRRVRERSHLVDRWGTNAI